MEIELYSKLNDPLAAIDRIGEFFTKSTMFGCDRPEQGKVLAMACIVEKKSPIQLTREYHIIEGKLSDRADSMLAKFLAAGGKHRVISRTPDLASVQLTTKGGEQMTFSLSWEDAQKEPFVNGRDGLKKNYRTPRARMQTLWARVISDGVRTLEPGIVAGILTPEEVEDEIEIVAKPSINLAPAQAAQPANVIDIESKKIETPEPAKPEVKAETPTPATGHADRSRQELEAKLAIHIQSLFGTKLKPVIDALVLNGALKQGQGFQDLSGHDIRVLLKASKRFQEIVEKQEKLPAGTFKPEQQ